MKTPIAAALFALALAGCGMHAQHHRDGPRPGAGDPRNPMVSVTNGVISVNPEPLKFRRAEGSVAIVWHLPPGYRFPDRGIVIDGRVIEQGKRPPDARQDEIVCPTAGGGRTFVCVNRNSVPGATYKYTIRVLPDGAKDPLVLDPEIMNLN